MCTLKLKNCMVVKDYYMYNGPNDYKHTLRATSIKVVVLDGTTNRGVVRSRDRPKTSAFFLLPFDQEAFKTC